jgi:hypothetical protein
MKIELSVPYVVAFLLLTIVMLELHETVLGDTVVFDTLGKAENGWIVRAAVILTRNSKGKFVRSGDRAMPST